MSSSAQFNLPDAIETVFDWSLSLLGKLQADVLYAGKKQRLLVVLSYNRRHQLLSVKSTAVV